MNTVASLLCGSQAIDMQLDDVLVEADEHAQAVVEGGLQLLRKEGLEAALGFLSANMAPLLAASRASILRGEGVQAGGELALAE